MTFQEIMAFIHLKQNLLEIKNDLKFYCLERERERERERV
jgi:hypothetical protein